MYKLFLCCLLLAATITNAQDKKTLDSVDNVIIKTLIQPALKQAGGSEPAWPAVSQQIRMTYTESQTDRALTKAQIYYYYSRNWTKFSTAIVHYTDTYEDKDDLNLMNKNAGFILQHSENPGEWQTAQGWIKHAVDAKPDNAAYKATYDALTAKLNTH